MDETKTDHVVSICQRLLGAVDGLSRKERRDFLAMCVAYAPMLESVFGAATDTGTMLALGAAHFWSEGHRSAARNDDTKQYEAEMRANLGVGLYEFLRLFPKIEIWDEEREKQVRDVQLRYRIGDLMVRGEGHSARMLLRRTGAV